MKRVLKILLKSLIALVVACVATIIGVLVYMRWGYYDDMHAIEKKLNNIKGVKVLDIWGNEDVTLEEIAARIQVAGKGEMVLQNLAVGDDGYAEWVSISEIGGYSFEHVSCNCQTAQIGIGSSLYIGTGTDFGKILRIKFESPVKLVENYDRIYGVIDSIYKGSNLVHFNPDSNKITYDSNEVFFSVIKSSSPDQSAIFNLIGIEDQFKAARKLPWNNDSCKVERY